jgi:exoribonuclease R
MYILAKIKFSSNEIYTDTTHTIMKKADPVVMYLTKTLLVKTKLKTNTIDKYAIIKITENDNNYIGSVERYVDDIDESILIFCNWTITKAMNLYFNKYINNYANNFTNHIIYSANIYSIDPPDCVDIDDAISIRQIDNLIEITIHIADVNAYVDINDKIINTELNNRITSIYKTNKECKTTTHLLPESLMKSLSLTDDKYKKVISVVLTYSNLELISTNFKFNLIKTINLTYEKADILKETNPDLMLMYLFGKQLNDKYNYYLVYDIHYMIAIYMMITNNVVATTLAKYDKTNVLLRKQSEIKTIKLEKTLDNFKNVLIQKYNNYNLQNAEYTVGITDCHHSSINLDYYTHFTSPIRRFVDMIVHKQLINYLNNEQLFKNYDITKINSINKYYKQVDRYFKNYLIDINKPQYEAYIVNIEYNNIMLYIPELNLDTYLKPIHRDLISAIDIKFENDVLTINKTNYKLFDKVIVKIIKINYKLFLSLI